MIEKIPFKQYVGKPKDSRLVKAAIRIHNDVYTGWRHSEIIRYVAKEQKIVPFVNTEMQGFVTADGEWLRRASCSYIAFASGQTTKYIATLCSEDLWDNEGNPNLI